jgi:peptidoglycan/xylan/chitin deacetylase (PgdA/CDA1 family)
VVSERAARSVALVYHRVVAGQRDPFELCVTPTQFAEHLDAVRASASVVPTDALPVLEATGTPATVFVCSDALETPCVFWWDRLAALVYRAPAWRTGRTITVADKPIRLRLAHRRSRFETIAALHRALRTLPPATVDEHLDELERLVGDGTADVPGSDRAYRIAPRLDAELLRTLAAHPLVTIGAHTRRHPWLTSLPAEEQRVEIEAGRDTLRAVLGHDVTTFAYPFGQVESFDDTTASLVREAGFEAAWTTVRGPVDTDADRFRLRRCSVGTRSPAALAAALREWLA